MLSGFSFLAVLEFFPMHACMHACTDNRLMKREVRGPRLLLTHSGPHTPDQTAPNQPTNHTTPYHTTHQSGGLRAHLRGRRPFAVLLEPLLPSPRLQQPPPHHHRCVRTQQQPAGGARSAVQKQETTNETTPVPLTTTPTPPTHPKT